MYLSITPDTLDAHGSFESVFNSPSSFNSISEPDLRIESFCHQRDVSRTAWSTSKLHHATSLSAEWNVQVFDD
ncbi:hypothetical protein A0H81_05160 [Grifola frondosa]|uniref:Uncharacterized protein n=1 Tax=Grifola frondosa TaxID=5627 RepID=A0A1C7ME66_GRIFR|nr:hypothetical protein A0H81_05160 [Grifola frondosa]